MVEGLPTVESVLHCIKLSTDGAHLLCQDGEVEAGGTEVIFAYIVSLRLEISLRYTRPSHKTNNNDKARLQRKLQKCSQSRSSKAYCIRSYRWYA